MTHTKHRVAEKLGMSYRGIRNAHELAERHPDMEVAYYMLEQGRNTEV